MTLQSIPSASGPAVVVGTNGLGASVFRGLDHGEFQQRVDLAGGFVVSVATGDFNGDGVPDLVVPSYFGASFTIFLGTADGGFSAGETHPLDGHGTWVGTGDFDEDGTVDIVAARNGSGQPVKLHVFRGNGDGTFSETRSYLTSLATPTEIGVARIDSDAHLDLAFSLSGPGTGAVMVGNGDGTFRTPELISNDTDPGGDSPGFALADLDADGIPDWIAARDFVDSVVVRRGDGAGHFLDGTRLPFPHPWDIAAADFDGDGRIDFVASNLDSAVCYRQDSNGAFLPAASVRSPGGVVKLLATDVDGDSFPDLVFSGNDGSFSVALNRSRASTQVDTIPSAGALLTSFPNPLRAATVIQFRLARRARARLAIYDLSGRRIALMDEGVLDPGAHEVRWDASRLAAGTYYCRLLTPGGGAAGKMTVLR